MCSPASVKILVMPTFCAMTPDRIDLTSIASSRPLQLDLDIDAGGEVELHQCVNGLRRRIDDVEQPLVGAHLELLAALLVDMRRAVHSEFLDPGRKRNRSPHFRTGALGRVDDLCGRRIENAMVEGFEPDSYVLTLHLERPLSRERAVSGGALLDSLLDDRCHDARTDGPAALAN